MKVWRSLAPYIKHVIYVKLLTKYCQLRPLPLCHTTHFSKHELGFKRNVNQVQDIFHFVYDIKYLSISNVI
jgi:hypothetical protein